MIEFEIEEELDEMCFYCREGFMEEDSRCGGMCRCIIETQGWTGSQYDDWKYQQDVDYWMENYFDSAVSSDEEICERYIPEYPHHPNEWTIIPVGTFDDFGIVKHPMETGTE